MFSEIVHSAHFFHKRGQQVLFLVITLLVDIVTKVSLVLLLRIYEGLDGVVAGLHAELDTLVKDVLRLIRGVNISLRQRLDKLFIVINGSINDSISDSFGYDLLCLFYGLKAQLRGDVGK